MTVEQAHGVSGYGVPAISPVVGNSAASVFTSQMIKAQMNKSMLLKQQGRSTNLHERPPSIAGHRPTAAQEHEAYASRHAAEGAQTERDAALPQNVAIMGGGVARSDVHAALVQSRKGSEPITIKTGSGAGRVSDGAVTRFVGASQDSQGGGSDGESSDDLSGSVNQRLTAADTRSAQQAERDFATSVQSFRSSRAAPQRTPIAARNAAGAESAQPPSSGTFSIASIGRSVGDMLARLLGNRAPADS